MRASPAEPSSCHRTARDEGTYKGRKNHLPVSPHSSSWCYKGSKLTGVDAPGPRSVFPPVPGLGIHPPVFGQNSR